MSNHYDDYYPPADDMARSRKRAEDEKVQRVANQFGVTEKKAKKMMDDFRVLYYNTVSR